LVEPEQPNTAANFEDLMARMTQAINQNQTQTPAVMQDITATQIGMVKGMVNWLCCKGMVNWLNESILGQQLHSISYG
jgi:hypothetical protein